MYLPFRIRSRYIIIVISFCILLFSPGQSNIRNLFVFFSQQLIFTPYRSLEVIDSLRKQEAESFLRIRQLEKLEEENKLLRKALGFKEERQVDLIGIDIVFFDPSVFRRVVIANAGRDKGVVKGTYVVDEEGCIAGKVIEVNNNYSKIVLVTDPDFTLPVFVGEQSFGLLKGGVGSVKVLYLENDEEIKLQDSVWIKTPFANALVLYIGQVKEVKRYANSLFLEVDVKLFSHNPFARKMFIMR